MKDFFKSDSRQSCCTRDSVRAVLLNQRRLLGPLLFSICVSAYAQSSTAASASGAERCDNPGAALLHTVEVDAGGPYVARVGVPITLHGRYTVAGQTHNSAQLKTIGQAMLSYLQANGSYPPAALLNKHGEPTVSWRVLLLPYLGEKELYERFDLEKSWDDPANLRLLTEMPEVYRNSDASGHTVETGFAGVQGAQSLFDKASEHLAGGRTPAGYSASEKIAVGPVGSGVHLPWTAPGDVHISKATQLGSRDGFSGAGHALTPLLFLDGTVRLMPDDVGTGSMTVWTHFPKMTGTMGCACAPPASVDAGIHATWDLAANGGVNTAGFDVTFLAKHAGTYHVTMHVFDHFGNEYNSQAKVEVR